MTRVLVFSGGGDYTDPWHPFDATTAILQGLFRDDGHQVAVANTLEALRAGLTAADVLVVNAGGGPEPHPLDDRLGELLSAYGGPVLAVHVAATLLPHHGFWKEAIGGGWVRGVSMHPARGPLRLRATERFPTPPGAFALDTVDEGYCHLSVSDDVEAWLTHDVDGLTHPVCWTLERDGRRSAYSALGHDAAAYDAVVARLTPVALVRWLGDHTGR